MPNDPVLLGLAALAETLREPKRAHRFLALTGIGTEELSARAGDPGLLAALIAFLEAHEPDLIGVAEGIGVEPGRLSAARRALEGGGEEP